MNFQKRSTTLMPLILLLTHFAGQAMEATATHEAKNSNALVSSFAKLPAELLLLITGVIGDPKTRVCFSNELLGDSDLKSALGRKRVNELRARLERIILASKFEFITSLSSAQTRARMASELLGTSGFTDPIDKAISQFIKEYAQLQESLSHLFAHYALSDLEVHPDKTIQYIREGANTQVTWGDKNLLTAATLQLQYEVVQELINAGPDLNTIFEGRTALIIAAVKGGENGQRIVEILIKAGALLDYQDTNYHGTALMWATLYGHEAIVRTLLAAGAGINFTDTDGNTALDLARRKGYASIASILEEAQATQELGAIEL